MNILRILQSLLYFNFSLIIRNGYQKQVVTAKLNSADIAK